MIITYRKEYEENHVIVNIAGKLLKKNTFIITNLNQ